MFEKEAEEIANKKLCATMMCYYHCNFSSPKHHRCGDWHRCYEIAKEGIEFGYNKCFEQIRKIMNEHTRLDCIIPELLRLKENG